MNRERGFVLIERGKRDWLVLLPGWAMDYRIFQPLNLNYNYIIPYEDNPLRWEGSLRDILDVRKFKVNLLGLSLGGFFAIEFTTRYPQYIEGLYLIGIRRKYPFLQLRKIREYISRNKKVYLYKFYRECIGRRQFKHRLFEEYIKEISLDTLKLGLNYLEEGEVDITKLDGSKPIVFIHGEQDRIAPWKEAEKIAKRIDAWFFCIKEAGHIPFWEYPQLVTQIIEKAKTLPQGVYHITPDEDYCHWNINFKGVQ